MKLRLLKRVKSWEEAGEVSASEADVNEIIESVRDDLEKLFNTRRGTVLVDEAFGLPDFTHLMNGYSQPDVSEIQENLQSQVQSYETRLVNPGLVFQESKAGDTQLNFTLTASFTHKNQAHSLTARVGINDNGSITVSL